MLASKPQSSISTACVLTAVLQVLCGAARQACCQAEVSIQSSAGQAAILPPKDLDCLCQLSTATLQLSSAICCDPAVALSLISAGTHASALEELKHAVKALTTMWTCCMQHLQHSQQQQGVVPGFAGSLAHAGSSSQHAWQGMIPSLAASVKHLLHMSVTSAEFVSSSSSTGGGSSGCGSSQAVPKEMCSMSVLNLSWINLTRLLVAVPEGVRPQVSPCFVFLRCRCLVASPGDCIANGFRTASCPTNSPMHAWLCNDVPGAGGSGLAARPAVCFAAAAHCCRRAGSAGQDKVRHGRATVTHCKPASQPENVLPGLHRRPSVCCKHTGSPCV